jgi:hypothetical protein
MYPPRLMQRDLSPKDVGYARVVFLPPVAIYCDVLKALILKMRGSETESLRRASDLWSETDLSGASQVVRFW